MASYNDAATTEANITFDESRLTSEKPSFEKSRSSSRIGSEIEGPHGIVRRNDSDVGPTDDMPQAMRTLSVASQPTDQIRDEPRWPTDWRAYKAWLGGFLLMFNSWGIVNAYGTYASYYRQHLMPEESNLLLNLIGATECFCILSLSVVIGRFIDAGYHRQMVTIGGALITLGQFLLVTGVGQGLSGDGKYMVIWVTQGLTTGLGMACYFVTSSAVAATWFKLTKSTCIGVVASGASISGLVYPIMLKFLISGTGFINAQLSVAGLVTALSLLTIYLCEPNPATQPRKPEHWRGWFNIRIFWDKHAFENKAFAWYVASIAWLFLGFYPIFFNLEEWAGDSGLGLRDETPGAFDISIPNEIHDDAIRTFYMLAILNGSSIVGRLSSGFLSDHFGALRVHCIVTFVASMLTLTVWTTADTVAHAMGFIVVFGIFSGAVIGLPPAGVAWILNPNDAEAQKKLGQWVGMMYTVAAIPALIGPLIAGILIEEFGNNYLTVQLWSGICLFLSASCMLIALFYADRDRSNAWTTPRKFSAATSSMSFLSKSRSRAVSEKEQV